MLSQQVVQANSATVTLFFYLTPFAFWNGILVFILNENGKALKRCMEETSLAASAEIKSDS